MTETTATFLAGLRAANERVDVLPDALHPASPATAYAAQAELVHILCATAGSDTAGYKIALSSPTAQSLVGVAHPIYGRLIGLNVYDSGVTLEARGFATRIIEVEFGFRLARDVPVSDGAQNAESIKRYVDAVYPSIELVDHHYGGLGTMTAEAIIADNAIHGAWIHGAAVGVSAGLDLAATPTALVVNGESVLTGAGNRTLGDPWAALAWLANELPTHGTLLKGGEYVTTGLTTDGIYDAKSGDELIATFGPVGEVRLQFS